MNVGLTLILYWRLAPLWSLSNEVLTLGFNHRNWHCDLPDDPLCTNNPVSVPLVTLRTMAPDQVVPGPMVSQRVADRRDKGERKVEQKTVSRSRSKMARQTLEIGSESGRAIEDSLRRGGPLDRIAGQK